MDIKHHFTDEFLLEYASGALETSWALAVAARETPSVKAVLEAFPGAEIVDVRDLADLPADMADPEDPDEPNL